MKIEAARDRGSAVVRLEGRLDREWAEHLSDTLERLLQDGVRSLRIDCARVTYVSSAAARVVARWQRELKLLRGDVQLVSLSPALHEVFAAGCAESPFGAAEGVGFGPVDLRLSSWHSQTDLARAGQYDLSSGVRHGALVCRLHGRPERIAEAAPEPGDCDVVTLPEGAFAVGIGAIGGGHAECHERFGELVAVAGCVAYFPTDGARMADYLVGGAEASRRATLVSGLVCDGGFARLVRFSSKPEAEAVPLSELATVGLEAVGGQAAGLVVAGETAGLAGARLRRSPGPGTAPVRFDVPAVRDWLSFAPERTHLRTTALIVGVVAREPEGPLAAHLRPLGKGGGLYGHFHAAVFSYRPLPQRTVELADLVRGLFCDHELRDVLHLISDDRGEAGVRESALTRGVGWIAPIAQLT